MSTTQVRYSLFYTLFCSLIAFLLSASQNVAKADGFATVVKEKKLTVGWIPFAKLSYRDLQTGQVKGVMVDVLEAIAKEMGIAAKDIKYVETDWGSFGVGLATRKFDISIAPTYKTIARATQVMFSQPLFYLGNSAVVRKDDERFKNVTSVFDFDRPGVTVAVIAGESSDEFAKRNFTKATVKSIKAADISGAFLEVSSKRADVAFGDSRSVRLFSQTQPSTIDVFKSEPWGTQALSWAVLQGEYGLLQYLNTALDVLQVNGTMRRILRKPEYEDVPFLVLDTHLGPVSR